LSATAKDRQARPRNRRKLSSPCDTEGPVQPRKLRVAIVAETRLYREGLADMLRNQPPDVVGTSRNADEALAQVAETRPDVVLLDMAMASGMRALEAIVEQAPGTQVVAIAIPDLEGEVVACAEAGAAGYVTRDASLEQLVAALESVARGETLCSPRVAATLFRRVRALAEDRAPQAGEGRLTRRKLEIVARIDQGRSNKEIANELCIELATVKNHVHNILEKLNVHRRGEAAARLRSSRAVAEPGSNELVPIGAPAAP
jgi:two-component system, NarL family, nitrate/nitrite response regulator NarL